MRLLLLVIVAATLFSSCGGGSDNSPSATGDPAETTVTISATGNTFSRSRIHLPAGQHVSIQFTNLDAAPHNIAVYETDAAEEEVFVGATIRGPDGSIAYEFDSPQVPGSYFFRCDVHPTLMTGEVIVE